MTVRVAWRWRTRSSPRTPARSPRRCARPACEQAWPRRTRLTSRRARSRRNRGRSRVVRAAHDRPTAGPRPVAVAARSGRQVAHRCGRIGEAAELGRAAERLHRAVGPCQPVAVGRRGDGDEGGWSGVAVAVLGGIAGREDDAAVGDDPVPVSIGARGQSYGSLTGGHARGRFDGGRVTTGVDVAVVAERPRPLAAPTHGQRHERVTRTGRRCAHQGEGGSGLDGAVDVEHLVPGAAQIAGDVDGSGAVSDRLHRSGAAQTFDVAGLVEDDGAVGAQRGHGAVRRGHRTGVVGPNDGDRGDGRYEHGTGGNDRSDSS